MKSDTVHTSLQLVTLACAIACFAMVTYVAQTNVTEVDLRELETQMSEMQQTIEHPGDPDYHAVVTDDEGTNHDVNTYCERMPDTHEGDCASWHVKRVQDLKTALRAAGLLQ